MLVCVCVCVSSTESLHTFFKSDFCNKNVTKHSWPERKRLESLVADINTN